MNKKTNSIRLKASPIVWIFLICCLVYLANRETISSGDTVTNTILAFNLLENHTLHLDAFRNSYFVKMGAYYAFAEGNNGHLSSTYPIGTAIVTFPLYVIFYAYLKCKYYLESVPILDLTSQSFEVHRLFFEKLAATIITAITVVLFYLSTRLKFPQRISLTSSFIFAFSTNTWMTSSQGLWQHGVSNLALISTIYCLLKANRTSNGSQKIWLLLAGVACGLLPGIRPTSTLFSIATIVYSIFIFRFRSGFLFLGLVSAIPSFAWNIYYFGNLTGGYSKMFPTSPYLFTLQNFIDTFLGILISPSRGLLIFSPIVFYSLFGTYKIFKLRLGKDEKMIGCMTIASLLLLASYCFYMSWWAGHSYGPRFTTDILPVTCYLINYCSLYQLEKLNKSIKTIFIYSVFITLVIYSTFTQFVGAFGATPGKSWNGIPLNIDRPEYQYRLWDIRDNQIERNAKALFHKIIKPSITKQAYIQGLSGKIQKITDENNQPLGSLISVNPASKMLIKARLINTGRSQWFGYESALKKGEVRVRIRFYDISNQQIKEEFLYVSGTHTYKEIANAIGSISFPQKLGTYKLTFDLIAQEVSEFPNNANSINKLYTSTVIVKENSEFSQEIQVLNSLNFGKIGEQVEIPVTVKNTSNSIWQNVGHHSVNLSYHWVDANGKVAVFDGERTPLSKSLPTQMSLKFNAIIKMPDQPGKYTLVLTMVKEGVAWFNERNGKALKIPVEVVAR